MPEEQRKSSSSSEFKNFAPRDLSSLFCFVFLPSLPSTVVVYAMTGAPWLQNFRDKGEHLTLSPGTKTDTTGAWRTMTRW